MNEAANGFLVGASIPLFSSRNKTKIAEARHTAAQSELENARMQAETQLMSKYNEIQQIRSAVEAYDVPLMHSTLRGLRRTPDAQHTGCAQDSSSGRPALHHRLLCRGRQRLQQPVRLPDPGEPVP